ncbi:endo alpha-1,4 polygalactosaminidase [Williamsia deligens]|uniref:Endo alpha-1,4 polygalactosaminidase n=1 Tax=Williamsia deligens TaxID=321325 RepID=A0ABW3G784_9NOCA|nr:endo alpha-1,4 polygalactosaminidase [Williamsia deligens]MCP2192887.1 Glycoside-hydrolase family GH114 [Williamsia deligens]
MTVRAVRLVSALALICCAAACSTGPSDDATPGSSAPHFSTPHSSTPVGSRVLPAGTFDYQLGGASPLPAGAGVVVRDATASPAPGVFSICYVNAFQTQPGDRWPADLLVRGGDGRPIVDPDWPDENIVDISTAARRDAAAVRVGTVIEECARAGYRAVELDNLDSWTRSGGAFDADAALAFARLLTHRAHRVGLTVAQKNAVDVARRGHDEAGFDFAITEECDRYDECAEAAAVYGGSVLDIEYTDNLRGSFGQVCARTPVRAILRDRGLVPAGSRGHVYAHC